MMTRSEFEAWLARFVWRDGDTEFEADLQYLIMMAEARISRDLIVGRRERRTTAAGTAGVFSLPADCYRLRSVATEARAAYRAVSIFDLEDRQIRRNDAVPCYALQDATVETTDREDCTYRLTYYSLLPAYTDAPTWLQNEYFDLYTNACLTESAPFNREEERLEIWDQRYAAALDAALREDQYRRYPSPPRARVPGVVA